MLRVKYIESQNVYLVDYYFTGRRAAFIKDGVVIDWDGTTSRKAIQKEVSIPLDWSRQSRCYAPAIA